MVKKLLIILLLSSIWFSKAEATHVVSADLTYECLGGLSYKFTYKLYRDCAGQSIGSFQALNYNSISLGFNSTALLFQDTSYEVSKICDSLLPTTSCGTGVLPGIEVYIYSTTITLPDSANDWNFENQICCRSTAISNLTPGFSYYTNTTLNNLDGKCNDSPTFKAIPILYSCVGQTVSFNNIAIDKEGDSLSFKLVRTWGANNLSIPYSNVAFNAINPFLTTSGIFFDSVTGQITFTSSTLQQVILTVLITEYDSLGNVKGTHRRDIQFLFIMCPPPTYNPFTTGVNFDTLNYTYIGCYNTPISFDVFSIGFDTTTPIVLDYLSNIPNATFTTRVNLDTTFGTFAWFPGTQIGNYYFRLLTIADICPIQRQNIFNYTITIDTVYVDCIDTTLYLASSGYQVIDSSFVMDFYSSGYCPVQNVVLSKDTFDCPDVGTTPVTVTTYYQNGLVKICTANVTLIDTISPIAGCLDTTIYLNSSGVAIIDTTFIHDFSIMSCGTSSITLSKYTFLCSEIGVNTVALIVTEIGGLKDTCYGIVTVLDTFMPKAICMDTTIYLDASGNATIDSSFIDNGSYDNCVIVKKYLSKDSYNCFDVGANNVTLFIEDFYGNIDSCSSIVTVVDTNKININCLDTTVYLNNGSFSITNSHIFGGSSSVCGIQSITLSNYVFTCVDTGINLVKIFATDNSGYMDSCYSTVTLIDTSRSIFLCKDTTIYLNSNGFAVIDTSFLLDTMIYSPCNLMGLYLKEDTFRCSNIGVNSVDLIAKYQYTTSDSCASLVQVLDTFSPVAICKNISVFLGSNSKYTIDSSFINNGSYDNCGVATIKLNKYNFNCGDVGTVMVTLTVTDQSGNSSQCTSQVTVFDTVNPNVICKNATVYLNSVGRVILDSSMINDGSYDSCGVATISISKDSFDCTNVGVNLVTLTVKDINGNVDSCVSMINVLDTISPIVVCKNVFVYLDNLSSAIIDSSLIDNGSSDNCGIKTLVLSKTTFNCLDVGINSVTLIATDVNGNIDSCKAVVTVIDSVNPIAICMDTAVYLSNLGSYTITNSYINNGSFDNCVVDSIVLSKYTFNCNDVGLDTITFYVYDKTGNVDSCTSVVTVFDTTKPTAVCRDTTIYLNSLGLFSITSNYINGSLSYGCPVSSIIISQYDFDCSHVGLNPIKLTVSDINGNSDSCTSIVTVLDTLKPIVNCQNISVYIDNSGNASIDSSMIDNGSSDNCGITSIVLSKLSFDCSNAGLNTITMTVTDVNGNYDTCNAIVTVIDSINPIANCKDTTIYVNGSGYFVIDSTFLENGSTDNCGVASITLSRDTFLCNDFGFNTVFMTVTDVNGNVSSCSSIVSVIDSTKPVVNCNDTTLYLNAFGLVYIDSSFIANNSSNNCGVSTVSISKDTFYCIDEGVNIVAVLVTDNFGNYDTCSSNVTVLDTLNPIVNCQRISVYLDNSGNAIIDSSMINNGSTDNCGIASITLDKLNFDCSNLGKNYVTLTVTDVNGNSDTCSAIVTVLDTIIPTAICMDTTVFLNNIGAFSITNSFINNGSFDNCLLDSISLSKYSFSCSDLGIDTIVMYVFDNSGNVDSCTAFVNVLDTTNLIALCKDTTVFLNYLGVFSITSNHINGSVSYGCPVNSIVISQYNFDCSNVGINPITLVVTDINGNKDSCTSLVTVLDSIKPVANCKNINAYLDNSGVFTMDSSSIDNGSTDNCGILTMKLSKSSFDCSNTGANSVTLIVTDVNGNVDSCTSIVTILDSIKPTTICKDTTVYLDKFGDITIDSSFINNGSYDNCGIASIAISKSIFKCSDIGVNSVSLIITDVKGNIDSCVANVTVVDSIFPIAYAGLDTNICGHQTIQLKATAVLSHEIGSWQYLTSMAIPAFSAPFPNVLSVNNPQSTITNLSKGTHFFSWTVSNGNGCNVVIDTIQVNILDSLIAFAGADISLCNQYSTNLMGVTPPYGISGSWSSLPGGPNAPVYSLITDPTALVSNLIEGTYPFQWTVSNGLCVDVHDTTLVEIYDLPTSSAGADQSLCATYSAVLSGNISVGRAQGVWSILSSTNSSSSLFLDSTVNNTTITGLQEGTYELLWKVSNGNCTPDVDTIVLKIYDLPISNAGLDTILCNIDSLNLFATQPVGTSTGVWQLRSNRILIGIPTIVDSSLYNTQVINLPLGQTQKFEWTVSNGNCPIAIDSILIQVKEKPIVIAGRDSSYCGNAMVSLSAHSIASGERGIWYVDTLNSVNVPSFGSPNNPNTTVSGLVEGTYYFVWRVKNKPCFDITDTVKVMIYDSHTAMAGVDQFLCNQNLATVSGNRVTGLAKSKWTVCSCSSHVPSFDSTLYTTDLTGLVQGGVYDMIWEINNGVCPASKDTVVVHNQFVPKADFFLDTDEICQNDSVSFYSTSNMTLPVVVATEEWTILGSYYFTPTVTKQFVAPGYYDVNLVVTASNGCLDTLYKDSAVFVHTNPIADFSIDYEPNTNLIKINDLSQFAASYTYKFGDGDSSNISYQNHTYKDAGKYKVWQIVANYFGCLDSTDRDVYIQFLNAYVPNSFTPNKDGTNDIFMPHVIGENKKKYEFTIYNRWGEVLFKTNSSKEGWDGTFNGNPVAIGVYVWKLNVASEIGSQVKEHIGNVNLIR